MIYATGHSTQRVWQSGLSASVRTIQALRGGSIVVNELSEARLLLRTKHGREHQALV